MKIQKIRGQLMAFVGGKWLRYEEPIREAEFLSEQKARGYGLQAPRSVTGAPSKKGGSAAHRETEMNRRAGNFAWRKYVQGNGK